MQITIDVPDHFFADVSPPELAGRVKLYAAVLFFRSGELSAGAAAELAGVDRYAFIQECARHGVPMIDYSPEELSEEVEDLALLLAIREGERSAPVSREEVFRILDHGET